MIAFELILYTTVMRCFSKESCPRLTNAAAEKRSGFLWGGAIDFLSELFLNIAFSVGINTSSLEMSSSSLRFNTIFCVMLGVLITLGPITIAITLAKQLKRNQRAFTYVESLEGGEKVDKGVTDLTSDSEASDKD